MPGASFEYTGGWQTFTVPTGVGSLDVTLNGAGSGGVAGGAVSGRLSVSGGQVLWIMVGRAGRPAVGSAGGPSGFGGGGPGGYGYGLAGGYGGGGATAIRVLSTSGVIRAVAGGAGGRSGDGGNGGRGGATTGEHGSPGTAGSGAWGNATGGTQVQGGSKGTSGAGTAYDGFTAHSHTLTTGGAGGGPELPGSYGGGGGGGGYHAGGGGQAGATGLSPGGGGGGGSNYVGGLVAATSQQGGGSTANGSVTLSWITPPPANQPPSVPTDILVNGEEATDEQQTNSTGTVTITGRVDDPNPTQQVRLLVEFSPVADFSHGVRTVSSNLVSQPPPEEEPQGAVVSVNLTGLAQNTRYFLRIYARDSAGMRSLNYRTIDFWTNRYPLAPEHVSPAENASISELVAVVLQWNHVDPDENSIQTAYRVRWRIAPTHTTPAGSWHSFHTGNNNSEQHVLEAGSLLANTTYEWSVQTRDTYGAWGPYSEATSFRITGVSTPPLAVEPIRDEARDVTVPVLFRWVFRDPDPEDVQTKADIRYRVVTVTDDAEWITLIGDVTTPGADMQWLLSADIFTPGLQYEWQVRTQDTIGSLISGWSESAYFWAIRTPGETAEPIPLITGLITPQSTLGCGMNRVFVYDRGGINRRGEITELVSVTWTRMRDDISNALIHVQDVATECAGLLAELHTWMHEIVIFRDGVRVFEGPITRITDSTGGLEIEAKDCMAYVYRRIMRQGYNDAYRVVNGQQLGDYSVVERAALIVINALAPDDPNLLPHLTTINYPDDAGQSRVVLDYSRTAWEEVDDLAATAGLDYTTVGRRIILWDTHRPLGRLPELRARDFSSPPVITEYGMQLATTFAVTNNSGVYGLAERETGSYGHIEQLASAYGETEGDEPEVLSNAAKAALAKVLTTQAERNIAGRWPAPIVVRVPDNSTLSPDANISINQLIPGVWVPLRAKGIIRELAQWQKLDSVTVAQTSTGELVSVVFSPAPNGGADPDAEGGPSE